MEDRDNLKRGAIKQHEDYVAREVAWASSGAQTAASEGMLAELRRESSILDAEVLGLRGKVLSLTNENSERACCS